MGRPDVVLKEQRVYGCTDSENGRIPDTGLSGKQYPPDTRLDRDIKFNYLETQYSGALAHLCTEYYRRG